MITFTQRDRGNTGDEVYPVNTTVEMPDDCAFGDLVRAFVYFSLALGYQAETIARELDEETARDLGIGGEE